MVRIQIYRKTDEIQLISMFSMSDSVDYSEVKSRLESAILVAKKILKVNNG